MSVRPSSKFVHYTVWSPSQIKHQNQVYLISDILFWPLCLSAIWSASATSKPLRLVDHICHVIRDLISGIVRGLGVIDRCPGVGNLPLGPPALHGGDVHQAGGGPGAEAGGGGCHLSSPSISSLLSSRSLCEASDLWGYDTETYFQR